MGSRSGGGGWVQASQTLRCHEEQQSKLLLHLQTCETWWGRWRVLERQWVIEGWAWQDQQRQQITSSTTTPAHLSTSSYYLPATTSCQVLTKQVTFRKHPPPPPPPPPPRCPPPPTPCPPFFTNNILIFGKEKTIWHCPVLENLF